MMTHSVFLKPRINIRTICTTWWPFFCLMGSPYIGDGTSWITTAGFGNKSVILARINISTIYTIRWPLSIFGLFVRHDDTFYFTKITHLYIDPNMTWWLLSDFLKPLINIWTTSKTWWPFLFYWNLASICWPYVRHEDYFPFTETKHQYSENMNDMMVTFCFTETMHQFAYHMHDMYDMMTTVFTETTHQYSDHIYDAHFLFYWTMYMYNQLQSQLTWSDSKLSLNESQECSHIANSKCN